MICSISVILPVYEPENIDLRSIEILKLVHCREDHHQDGHELVHEKESDRHKETKCSTVEDDARESE